MKSFYSSLISYKSPFCLQDWIECKYQLACLFVFFGIGEKEIIKKITDLQKTEKGLTIFTVDMLDYHSILEAVKGCCALFCCLDSPFQYEVKFHIFSTT